MKSVVVPTTRDSRAQVGVVTHGRAFYCLTRAREYHVSSADVNPAIAEPVSPTEKKQRVNKHRRAPVSRAQANERQQAPSRCRVLAEERHAVSPTPCVASRSGLVELPLLSSGLLSEHGADSPVDLGIYEGAFSRQQTTRADDAVSCLEPRLVQALDRVSIALAMTAITKGRRLDHLLHDDQRHPHLPLRSSQLGLTSGLGTTVWAAGVRPSEQSPCMSPFGSTATTTAG